MLPQASAAPSIISADMRISGDLRTAGDVQVDGTIDGDIQSTTVTVGKSAEINGEIAADTLIVWGRVNGRIRCKDVTLEETAVVNGDVFHESIQVARGAKVEGMMRRGLEAHAVAHPTIESEKPTVALVSDAKKKQSDGAAL